MFKNNIFLKSIFISNFLILSITCNHPININLFAVEKENVSLTKLTTNQKDVIEQKLLELYTDGNPDVQLIIKNGTYHMQAKKVILQTHESLFIGRNNFTCSINLCMQSALYCIEFRKLMLTQKIQNAQSRPVGTRK